MFADWHDGDVDVDCVPLLVGLCVCDDVRRLACSVLMGYGLRFDSILECAMRAGNSFPGKSR